MTLVSGAWCVPGRPDAAAAHTVGRMDDRSRPRPFQHLPDAVRLLALVIGLLLVVGFQRDLPAESAADTVEPLVEVPLALGQGLSADRLSPPLPPTATVVAPPRLRSVSTAPVRPWAPAPDGAHHHDAVDVEVHRPVLRLDGAAPALLEAVRADPDVSHAAVLEMGALDLRAGPTLSVAVVDPTSFRPLTPRVTAQSEEPWAALDRGEALLSPDVAGHLGLRAGDALRTGWRAAVPVGGSASNGAPPLADVVVAEDLEVDIGTRATSILVAAVDGADVAALAERLAGAHGLEPAALPPAEPATASLVGDDAATLEAFVPFTFRAGAGGRIEVDPAWEAEHIVTVELPILGTARCHRLMVPQLTAALDHLVDHDLAHLLDPDDFGGCYLPRHIDWNPDASLSMHAWGLAFDVNVATNGLGETPQLDAAVVDVFTSRGFSWGGDWRRPDGMHFELARLLDADELAAVDGR